MKPIGKWCVAMVFSALPAICVAQQLTFLTEDYPPFNFQMEDGKSVVGRSTDTLIEMARRANIPATVEILPWARALNLALSDLNTCVFSTIRSPAREDKYKWIGPLESDSLALFALAERKMKMSTLGDVKQYVVGTYLGSYSNEILLAQGINIDVAPKDVLNLKKLSAGYIDLWVASRITGPYVAKREGIKNISQVMIFGKEYQMYLACNINMPEATVTKLNQILSDMKADGTVAKVYAKYQ